MKQRAKKILSIYKKASDESEGKVLTLAKKLMSMPEEKICEIICTILKESDSIKDSVYNKVYKEDKKLEGLA
jgi:hypothetical protein